MDAIKIQNVVKAFGNFKALNGLNVNVKEGEIFGYLGPNGAGKTTTIRCMLDFIRPTTGKIEMLGLNPAKNSASIKAQLGYLPADNSIYRTWTGREHFAYLQSMRQTKSTTLKKLISTLDFNPKIRAGKLSSGNLQKLSIILALMFEPKLLILDEPTKALDPLLQHQFYTLLKDMNKSGTTIFVSSHNLTEVENLCTRAGIIKQGRVIATEEIAELKRKRMHIVELIFADIFDSKEFNLPVVDQIDNIPNGLRLKVKSDLNPVLQIVAKHKMVDMEISHASLEEIFLEFYK